MPHILVQAILTMLLVSFGLSTASASVRARANRAVDASNIRQIMQASIIYATEHNDQFPQATDIWNYAEILAIDTGLNEPRMWTSRIDPASDDSVDELTTITLKPKADERPSLNPSFKKAKLSIAVPLGPLNLKLPATTPIAWTRGLQPDGTWAKHSPYGDSGGWITFIGGNTAYYKNLNDPGSQLIRFGGTEKTSNIQETLPPGTRISEYIPTDEEKAAWSKATRQNQKQERLQSYVPLFLLALLWLPFIAISIYRGLKKRPGSFTVLLWPIVLTILFTMVMPCCW